MSHQAATESHGEFTLARLERARLAAATVCDPEIPSLTLEDLGVLREVALEDEQVVVSIAPTYTGCPATDTIRDDVASALAAADVGPFRVRITLSPPWSSDSITAAGRRKLIEAGIAPPACASPAVAGAAIPMRFVARSANPRVSGDDAGPNCPRCSSPRTERLSEYGSTACKALYRCLSCAEPFDYFKPY